MCIIIDVNAIPSVFNLQASDHQEFRPVMKWIRYGKGKMVYGGTTYRQELRQLRSYLGLIAEYNKAGKVIEIEDREVDEAEGVLINKINDPKCNDCHIIAIVIVSGCRLVCSKDRQSFDYIKDRSLYCGNARPPSLYTRKSNRGILTDEYIVTCRHTTN
jgi:hypothetical protein